MENTTRAALAARTGSPTGALGLPREMTVEGPAVAEALNTSMLRAVSTKASAVPSGEITGLLTTASLVPHPWVPQPRDSEAPIGASVAVLRSNR